MKLTRLTLVSGFVAVCAAGLAGIGGAHGTETRCVAISTSSEGSGFATFLGNCNGYKTSITASSGAVLGRVGGLTVALVGQPNMAGRIGARRTSYAILGSTITGHYGDYQLRFTMIGNVGVGHVGSARVVCTRISSDWSTLFVCRGTGAEALIPVLARRYAAP